MNLKKIELLDQEIEPLFDEMRDLIKASPWPLYLTKVENSPYGLGKNGNVILELFEKILSMVESISVLVKDEYDSWVSPQPQLSLLISLHIGFSYGAKEMDELTKYTVRTVNSFQSKEIKDLLLKENVYSNLLGDILTFTKKKSQGDMESVMESICAWFHLFLSSIEKISLDPRYRKGKKLFANTEFDILDLKYEIFKTPMEKEDPSSVHLPITVDEIIGNRDYISKGQRLLRDLLAFDPTANKNPKIFNQILFGLGRPGCGKTATANALGNYLIKEANKLGTNARFVVIRRTDWASSYQNASSKALIERFTLPLKGYKGVVLFYWADIDTAFSSRGDGDLRSEERDILGTVFGLFDGTILPFNGQWGLICDANYMQMDEATVSRLAQEPCVVKGPENQEDYISLLKDILLGEEYGESLEINQDQWKQIGEIAMESNLSGRDLANLSRRVISEIENFEYPEGFFQGDFEERMKMVKSERKTIDNSFIIREIERVEEFKATALVMEEEEKLKRRINEIQMDLSARETVLNTLSDKDI
jgi:AAA+ superfamily predicted ATPase